VVVSLIVIWSTLGDAVACDSNACKLERYDFGVGACGSLNSGGL
jgi:hypothetical protein